MFLDDVQVTYVEDCPRIERNAGALTRVRRFVARDLSRFADGDGVAIRGRGVLSDDFRDVESDFGADVLVVGEDADVYVMLFRVAE